MPRVGVVVLVILAIFASLLLGGLALTGFTFSNIGSQVLNGIGVIGSAIGLAFVIAMDLIFVVLIVRTPNRWWQP